MLSKPIASHENLVKTHEKHVVDGFKKEYKCFPLSLFVFVIPILLVYTIWVPQLHSKRNNFFPTSCRVAKLEDVEISPGYMGNNVIWEYALENKTLVKLLESNRQFGLILNQTEWCWYQTSNVHDVRFDNFDKEYFFAWFLIWDFTATACLYTLSIPIQWYCWKRSKKFKISPPPQIGMHSFLMGHHGRVGKNSEIYKSFRSNVLYAPQLSNLILEFVDDSVKFNYDLPRNENEIELVIKG